MSGKKCIYSFELCYFSDKLYFNGFYKIKFVFAYVHLCTIDVKLASIILMLLVIDSFQKGTYKRNSIVTSILCAAINDNISEIIISQP